MDAIKISSYDSHWPVLFRKEKQLLESRLVQQSMLGIHHIGSTAIPGMPAKPIIDILISVRSVDRAKLTFPEILDKVGYDYWYDNPKKDRLFFVKGLPPRGTGRTHHIHVYENDELVKDHLTFRDCMREAPDEASKYAKLKQALAEKFAQDREAYTDAKSDFISSILDKASQSQKNSS